MSRGLFRHCRKRVNFARRKRSHIRRRGTFNAERNREAASASRTNMTTKDHDHRCKAKTKTGKPCRAAPTEGGLCFFHANPDKASQLGRNRGQEQAPYCHRQQRSAADVGQCGCTSGYCGVVDRRCNCGQGSPQESAAGLAPLMNLQLHAIKTADIEQRLAKLEQQLKLREGASHEPSVVSDQNGGY